MTPFITGLVPSKKSAQNRNDHSSQTTITTSIEHLTSAGTKLSTATDPVVFAAIWEYISCIYSNLTILF